MRSPTFFTIIFWLIIGMVVGIFITSQNIINYWWAILVGSLVWIFFIKKLFPVKSNIILVLLATLFFSVGFWRTNYFHQMYLFDAFNKYNQQTINLVGTVTAAPVVKPGKQSVRIHPTLINGQKISDKTQDIVASFSDLETFDIGDQLLVSGKFTLRQNFTSDTDRIVQYRLMSYSKKIAGDIRYPKLDRVIPSRHQKFSNIFIAIKNKFITTLNELFIAPASGLLSGIIIGDTSSLDNTLLDIFRAVGLIHIVVLSGYNITLVANFFIRVFAPLGYYRRLVVAMIVLIFFIAVVGISQTALRAGIMALCAFSARYFLRPYMITRGIALALVVMTWISPYAILFDLSLQLSFLATIGIVYIFPLLQERYAQLAENSFGEILLQTIAVNIMTLPLIIYQMGTFSFISFPINILVLGIVPWITIFGFTAVFVGMVFFSVGKIMAYPIQIIIDVIINISTWVSYHDPLQVTTQPFSLYWIIGIYSIILYYILFKSKSHHILLSSRSVF